MEEDALTSASQHEHVRGPHLCDDERAVLHGLREFDHSVTVFLSAATSRDAGTQLSGVPHARWRHG